MILGDFNRRLDTFERMMEDKLDRIIALLETVVSRLDDGALEQIDLRTGALVEPTRRNNGGPATPHG